MSMSPRAKNFLSAVNGLAPSWFTRVQWRERVRMRCPHCRRNLAQKERSSAGLPWDRGEGGVEARAARAGGGRRGGEAVSALPPQPCAKGPQQRDPCVESVRTVLAGLDRAHRRRQAVRGRVQRRG